MKLRIATFNVENLFQRVRPLNYDDNALITELLDDIGELEGLLKKPVYEAADKKRMVELLKKHDAHTNRTTTRHFFIQQVRGKLYSSGQALKITAKGADDWEGWIEFDREILQAGATENTARVLQEVNADIVCLVEVEDRPAVERFCAGLLHQQKFRPKGGKYGYAMVIDGNDPRGIDVGLLSRREIGLMISHVHDRKGSSETFSRDCPEYEVKLNGQSLWILCNHLKSQGYGSPATNNARRKRQAEAVRDILKMRYDLTKDLVVVAGDMNDQPDSKALEPLLTVPDLHNVLDGLAAGEPRYTYAYGSKKQEIDFLLASKPLWERLTKAGIERRGMAGEAERFPEVTNYKASASDHACVWAEFEV